VNARVRGAKIYGREMSPSISDMKLMEKWTSIQVKRRTAILPTTLVEALYLGLRQSRGRAKGPKNAVATRKVQKLSMTFSFLGGFGLGEFGADTGVIRLL
jgi:hypothetical protein